VVKLDAGFPKRGGQVIEFWASDPAARGHHRAGSDVALRCCAPMFGAL